MGVIREMREKDKKEVSELLKIIAECRDIFDALEDSSMQIPSDVPVFLRNEIPKLIEKAKEETRQQCAYAYVSKSIEIDSQYDHEIDLAIQGAGKDE